MKYSFTLHYETQIEAIDEEEAFMLFEEEITHNCDMPNFIAQYVDVKIN